MMDANKELRNEFKIYVNKYVYRTPREEKTRSANVDPVCFILLTDDRITA